MNLNPVLDALLAQVVSSKPLPARSLLEPVDQTAFAQVARQLHSDSRLNNRANHYGQLQALFDGKRPAPNASSITTLDQAARTISDLMLAFPRDAKGMSVALDKMTHRAFSTPGAVANHIQTSMSLSGLFFESHIARWYRGEWSLERLRTEMTERLKIAHPNDPASLKSALLMRHQLDLLAGRPFRLEGNLTDGLAMILLAQPDGSPVEPWENSFTREHEQKIMQRIRLRLTHLAFEYADIDLALIDEHLCIRLGSPDVLLVEYFRRDVPALSVKLKDMGFSNVTSSRSQYNPKLSVADFNLADAVNHSGEGRLCSSPVEALYGTESELITHLALENDIKFTPHMLMLLMHCNHDARLSPLLFGALELLVTWSTEQIPHLG